ncbi:unnamed protein product [Calicophoron daubneyi]|uniref:EF-hand domain-containing protein n=1 Tax=Calicophoron daubneyi TaxID=300641 RepID=A0AAV2TIR7_CALDB
MNTSRGGSFKQVMEMFMALDVNETGVLPAAEFRRALLSSGMRKELIEKVFDRLGPHHEITLERLKDALGYSETALADCRSFFGSMDVDGSGTITVAELAPLLRKMNPAVAVETVNQWIKDHDKNGDGKLNFEEFREFMLDEFNL